ncbi:MAG TPA: hypothetical protein VGM93_13090 [Acidimicrobiales bacterium]
MEREGVQGSGAATQTVAPAELRHLPFADTVELKVEPSGRIVLPSAFRPAFAAGGYLRTFEGPSLALWTAYDFVEFVDRKLTERRKAGLGSGQVRKALYATSKSIKPDAQGRVILAEDLRKAAGIATELVVVGAFDRIELWEPAKWKAASAELAVYLDFELSAIDDVDAADIPTIPGSFDDGEPS